MKEYITTISDAELRTKLYPGKQTVEINGTTYAFRFTTSNSGYILIDDKEIPFCDITRIDEAHYEMTVYGYLIDVIVQSPLDSLLKIEDEISGSIHSPMTGVVTAMKIKVGQKINKDEVMLILSAMKMENEILAPLSGTISQIKCEVDQQVNSGDLLIEIIPLDE